MKIQKIKDLLKKPLYVGIAGILIGLILGLLIGWVFWPVQWTDASAENLRADLQKDYLENVILAFQRTKDADKAIKQYQDLGKNAELTLSEIIQEPGSLTEEQILRFSQAVHAEDVVLQVELTPEEVKLEEPLETDEQDSKKADGNELGWLGLILLLLLGGGAAVIYFLFLRNRIPSRREALPDEPEINLEEQPVIDKVANLDFLGQEKPAAQFMTTYMFGDDLFDDSFTFDAPNGEFLGECGLSIGDTIGVGEPKKISAFEVWLFDKNDVETVTKVVMSAHVFDDLNLRQRMESRGEPILAEPAKQIILETATLRLEARIVDMSYGTIPLPESSYFQRLTMELVVWQKNK